MKRWVVSVVCVVVFLVYLTIGGVVYHYIEHDNEVHDRSVVTEFRESFLGT